MSVERAAQLLDLGRWSEAEATYKQVLASDPHNDDARVGHGLAQAAAGARSAALRDFSEVLRRSPERTDARYHRAIVSSLLGHDEAALADLDRLLDAGFREWYVLSDRGALALRNGWAESALTDLREAERLAPSQPAVHLNLGLALLAGNNPTEAFRHLVVAADAGLGNAASIREQARRALAGRMEPADLEAALGELAAAMTPDEVFKVVDQLPALLVSEVVDALEVSSRRRGQSVQSLLRPRLEDLHRLVARIRGTKSVASRSARRLPLKGSPEDADRYRRLAERLTLLHRRGYHREVAELAPKVCELALHAFGRRSVEYGLQSMDRAVIAARADDWDTADSSLSAGVEVLGELDPALLANGLVSYAALLSMGRRDGGSLTVLEVYELAASIVQRLVDSVGHGTIAKVYCGYGRALLDAGEAARAEAILRNAANLPALGADDAQGSLSDVLTTLAETLFDQSRSKEAIPLCRRVVELSRQQHGDRHPAVAKAMRGLGRVYRAAGDIGMAVTWLNDSVSLWKQFGGAGANSAELALTQSDLALACAEAGSAAQARAVAMETLATLASLMEHANAQTPPILSQLRQTYRLLGDLQDELEVQLRLVDEVKRLHRGGPSPQELNTLADVYFRMRHYDEARRWYSAALDTILAQKPVDHEGVAFLRHNLANVLADTGQNAAALALHEEALDGLRRALGPGDPRLLQSLVEVAEFAFDEHQLVRARELLDEAHPYLNSSPTVQRRAARLASQLGDETISPDTGYGALAQEAMAALKVDDHKLAVKLLEEALPLAREVVDLRHPDVATIEHHLAVARFRGGTLVGTANLLRDALSIRESTLDRNDERLMNSRLELASVLEHEGHETEAAQLAAAVLRTSGIERRPLLAGRAHSIAGLIAHRAGRFTDSEQHLCAALRLADGGRDEENQITARRNLILLLLDCGRLDEADEQANEALMMCLPAFGSDDPRTAAATLTLAKVLRSRGRFAEGEALVREVIELLKRLGMPDSDWVVLDAYNELSIALHGQGQTQRALAWSKRLLTAAANSTSYDSVILNQARMYLDSGYFEGARGLVEQAVDKLAQRVGTQDPRYGQALGLLGEIELHGRQRNLGINHLAQAHQILLATLGPGHPKLIQIESALAHEYLLTGARETALAFARKAVILARRAYGEGHPALAPHLIVLARCEAVLGGTAEALRLSQEAIDLTPSSTAHLRWLGWLYAALGDGPAALKVIRRIITLQDAELPDILASASEAHRRAFLTNLWETVDDFLTLALSERCETGDSDLAREAWDLVGRRRGINAEHLRRERQSAFGSDRPDLARRLRELSELRAELAKATYADDLEQAARLTTRREELEQLLAARVGPSAATTTPFRPTVPAETTYVEYVDSKIVDAANLALGHAKELSESDPLQPRAEHRYVAFVVINDDAAGDVAVHMVDLGDAELIDELVAKFRAELVPLSRPDSDESRAASRDNYGAALRARLIDPLRQLFEPAHARLLVVADGLMSLLPLQILPSADGGRLLDHYAIAYVASASELRRHWEPGMYHGKYHEQGPPLVVADPDYDLGGAKRTVGSAERLQATQVEGEKIAALLATETFSGAAAVKMVLEEARSPRLLHIATHGLFLPVPKEPVGNVYEALYVLNVPGEGHYVVQADPLDSPDISIPGLPSTDSDTLLRSAIIFAGFNTWLSGGVPPAEAGNGILTADEVCALDLGHTRLVVLSACETGLGDPRPAEGVVGLRWAFTVAGASSVVTSLWKVPDHATQELMVEFYRSLLGGATVPDAMRAAQLNIDQRYHDPYFWGAFVCHGDPTVSLRE